MADAPRHARRSVFQLGYSRWRRRHCEPSGDCRGERQDAAGLSRADERNADEQVTELLAKIGNEWSGIVKSLHYMSKCVPSDARRLAYTARRVAKARVSIARMWAGSVPAPGYRALDRALEAVEFETGVRS
jgi:hypothetical protein